MDKKCNNKKKGKEHAGIGRELEGTNK